MLRFLRNKKLLNMMTASQPTQSPSANYKSEMAIGGGLEKLQGCLKEEKYFQDHDNDLMNKMGEEGTKLKCETVNDCNQLFKILNASDDRSALRETCTRNKHKNCLEEAYFLNEQYECCTQLSKKDNFTTDEANLDATIKKFAKNIQ